MTLSAYAQNVIVQGNRRVDTETIRSYFTGSDQAKINIGIKDLYATGYFSDVKAERRGSAIVVRVVENNVINRVAFEGNSKIKGEQLSSEVKSKTKGPFDPNVVQADIERILETYRRAGRGIARVTSRIVDLPGGKFDVVFTIDEGDKTGVKAINFVGNSVYSDGKLRGLMQLTESNFLSFFKTSDVYDPDRLSADEELIRRFYLKNGYADFRIVGQDVRFDAGQGGYIITISVEEGRQYRLSSVDLESRLNGDVNNNGLRGAIRLSPGDVYDGDLVEKSVEGLTRQAGREGYAFATVKPRGDRDPTTGLIKLGFVIEEGPRAYIERINIRGNVRTRDYVIRREFEIGEGDAYNKVLIDKTERRLNGLGYFKKVKITQESGSAPDRVVINVEVEDQPTGSFSISGGYSTTDGLIAEVSVTESNFLGRGQFVRLAVSEGQHARGVDFSFTEPYLFGQRLAGGVDLFAKQSDNTQYALYSTFVVGGTLRLGLPVTDEITFSPRYSLYNSRITIPNTKSQPYNDCTFPIVGTTPLTAGQSAAYQAAGNTSFNGNPAATAVSNCLSNGEASLAVKESQGNRLTSLVGYSLSYNTLDNPKNPTDGIYAELRQDIAGLGGDSKFIRTTGTGIYYHPIWDEIIGFAKLQAGDIYGYGNQPLRITDNFNLGPSLVRGFAPGGIGPRDITIVANAVNNPLGGTKYFGGTLEAQFPIPFAPRDIGIKGAVFADAGTLFGYQGRTNFNQYLNIPGTACQAALTQTTGAITSFINQGSCINVSKSSNIRSSVGASLIWASPLGPIRFDYAFVLSKNQFDQVQNFRFSGGSSF